MTHTPLIRGGSRIAWIGVTAGGNAYVHIFDTAQKAELYSARIKKFPASITDLQFTLDGNHLVWFDRSSDRTTGGLWSLQLNARKNSTTVSQRRFASATDLRTFVKNGEEFLSTYRMTSSKNGSERHSVEVTSLLTGKRAGKATTLAVSSRGTNSALGFRLNHFTNAYTYAAGTKSGRWDPSTKIRSLDTYAEYSLPERSFVKTADISDVNSHREFLSVRQNGAAESEFLAVKGTGDDKKLVIASTELRAVTLAEPLAHYSTSSLEEHRLATGAVVFSLQIDPVHPEAAEAKIAAKKWTDYYYLENGKTSAQRLARVFSRAQDEITWQGSDSYLALLEKHRGFDRGGPRLYVFQLK